MNVFYAIFSIFLLMPVAYSISISVTPDSVAVKELSSIPVLTPLVSDEQAYKYMLIMAVPGTIMEFDVNQSWMKENGINIIYLSTYAAGAWNPITAELTGSKDGQNIYRASIDEPSYFAIFGKNAPGEIQATASPQTGLLISKSMDGINGIIIMLLLAAIILIICLKRA